MEDVRTRVVVITGGSSGIGRCAAVLFARRGWRIGLIARGAQGLAACRLDAEAAGAWVATAQADVSESKALAQGPTRSRPFWARSMRGSIALGMVSMGAWKTFRNGSFSG